MLDVGLAHMLPSDAPNLFHTASHTLDSMHVKMVPTAGTVTALLRTANDMNAGLSRIPSENSGPGPYGPNAPCIPAS